MSTEQDLQARVERLERQVAQLQGLAVLAIKDQDDSALLRAFDLSFHTAVLGPIETHWNKPQLKALLDHSLGRLAGDALHQEGDRHVLGMLVAQDAIQGALTDKVGGSMSAV